MSEIRERFDRADSSALSGSLAHAKLRNARRLFNDGAAVHRLGGKDLPDATLFDDRVVTTGQTRSGKQILDIAQATDLVVQQILALARSHTFA